METGRPEVEDHLCLCTEFEASLGLHLLSTRMTGLYRCTCLVFHQLGFVVVAAVVSNCKMKRAQCLSDEIANIQRIEKIYNYLNIYTFWFTFTYFSLVHSFVFSPKISVVLWQPQMSN